MGEIEPCPVCAGPGRVTDHDEADEDMAWITCEDSDCPIDTLPPDVWNELSRAARLLAAVERIEQAIKPKAILTIQYAWYTENEPVHFVVHFRDTAKANRGYLFGNTTLAESLIALSDGVKL